MSLHIPVGSRKFFSPAQLADRAIDAIAAYRTPRLRNARYGVFMDHKGRVWLDKPPDALHENWLLTITRKTNPLDITDEIRSAEE